MNDENDRESDYYLDDPVEADRVVADNYDRDLDYYANAGLYGRDGEDIDYADNEEREVIYKRKESWGDKLAKLIFYGTIGYFISMLLIAVFRAII